jgi:hypothetical protein
MNLIRMFAFVSAVLITAFLFRVIAYDLTSPAHAQMGTSQVPIASVGSQSRGD